jgi:CysZ protein
MSRTTSQFTELTQQADSLKNQARGFGFGFSCLFTGLSFVYSEHRELARFYLPPMLLSFTMILGGWIFFGLNVSRIVEWVWAEPDSQTYWGLLHILWSAASIILWLLFAFTTAITSAITFTIVAAPFSDLLSERIEGILGTWEPRPFSLRFIVDDLGRTIQFELIRAAIKLGWMIPLFVASLLIPVVGQILYFTVGGYILSKYTGMDFVDWPAARRGWSWSQRFAFAKQHRSTVTGLGAAVVLSLLIPMAFAFVWPGAVAGGAILFTTLHDEPETGTVQETNDRKAAR